MTIHMTKTPQFHDRMRWAYAWTGRVLTATLEQRVVQETPDGTVQVAWVPVASEDFDFSLSVLGPGDEVAEIITTVLPVCPVVRAECDAAGDLYVTVVEWYQDAANPPDEVTEQIPEV